MDCSDLLPGLSAVAKALNEGDLGLAMIATQLMQLPRLNQAEAERAKAAEEMLLKASPDHPEHPGWPRGAPDSLGGKYRRKNAETIAVAKTRVRQLVTRRAYREGLRTLLRPKRLALLLGDAASNFVPGAEAIGDMEAVYEAKKILDEFKDLRVATDAALKFAEGGPKSLEEL